MNAPKDTEFRPKARRPRGLQDRRGPGLAAERALIAKVSAVYEAWGFEPLDTSAFEYADCLGKFLPDQDRPNEGVFALPDDDEQWLSLRYDLTAPLARFTAEHFDALPKPYRRWAAGPVWRNEKPGPGRFREFWQCDADTVGSASPAADAEMVAMACAALEAAGVRRGWYRVHVSDRRLLNGVLENAGVAEENFATRLVVLRAIDKYDRLGVNGVIDLLGRGRKDGSGDFTPGAGLSATSISKIIQFVEADRGDRSSSLRQLEPLVSGTRDGDAALVSLAEIDSVLRALGVGDEQAWFDTSIVRGLEYYTGAVFEAGLIYDIGDEGAPRLQVGSVGGGGRYDDLVARFRGERIPATGFSIGVSRLAAALAAAGDGSAEADGPVVILAMDKARIAEYFAMAAELRAGGVAAEVYLGGAGMKAQMKYADKRRAPVAVIQGGDEAAKGVVTLKNLKLGASLAAQAGDDREAWNKAREQVQVEVARGELVAGVKQMLQVKP